MQINTLPSHANHNRGGVKLKILLIEEAHVLKKSDSRLVEKNNESYYRSRTKREILNGKYRVYIGKLDEPKTILAITLWVVIATCTYFSPWLFRPVDDLFSFYSPLEKCTWGLCGEVVIRSAQRAKSTWFETHHCHNLTLTTPTHTRLTTISSVNFILLHPVSLIDTCPLSWKT